MTLVIVPYRADGGHRDRLWAHLLEHYWGKLPHTVVIGNHTVGPFNRSAAINVAADRDWDVAVIADSDTWVPRQQLTTAIATARQSGRLTAAFTQVVEIDRRCTAAVLAGTGSVENFGIEKVRTSGMETQSSMLVIPRRLWDHIGGFDERFVGWGGEDNAFWQAAAILGRQPHRIPGSAYHLWHSKAVDTTRRARDPNYQSNLRRWARYRVARTETQLRRAQDHA